MNAVTEQAAQVPSTRPYSQWFEPHPALGISLMDHLYNRLDGAYPHKWRSNFANQQAIDNWMESWVEAFEEEGITPELVRAGLKVVRRQYDWPPSCAEFMKACKPPLDPLVAYYAAVEGVRARRNGEDGIWSHPAIYWAAMPLSFDLLNQTYSQIKTRWDAALEAQMARGEWEPIPAPALALPAPDKNPQAREQAAQMLQQLGAAGIINDGGTKQDPLRWARKILEREKNGDKSIPAYCLREAKIAMGILPMPGGAA